MQRVFIVNPTSGGYRASHSNFSDALVLTPKTRDEMKAAVREAALAGKQIVIFGGDGTLHLAVNALFENGKQVNPDACLAVGPGGTGSDYARAIYQNKNDWKRAVEKPVITPVDVIRVSFSNPSTPPIIAINIVSVGISARVVEEKARTKSYLLPLIRGLFSYHPIEVEWSSEEKSGKGEVLGIFAGKGKFVGKGMKIGLDVGKDDGLLGVRVVHKEKVSHLLPRLPKLFSGNLDHERFITQWRTKHLRISCKEPVPIEMDGEIFGTTDVEISVYPRALRLCLP